jgi:peptide/nickel transport system permease protein
LTRFIIRRVIRGLIAILAFQSFLFFLIQALPYDFTAFLVLGPENQRFAQSDLGLDLPLWQQYFQWTWGFFRFDLGRSFLAWPTPVSTLLAARAPRTLILFLTAAVLSYLLGIWLGKIIAWHRGGFLEFGVTLVGVASFTSFAPFLGFVLIAIFGWNLNWLPFQQLVDPNIWYKATVTVDYVLIRMVITALLLILGFAILGWIARQTWQKKNRRWTRLIGSVLIVASVIIWWAQSGLGVLANDVLLHIALPLMGVILLSFGETMLLMRTTMLETIGDEYVLTARAKGLPENVIRDHHVARNAFLPVLTRLLLNFPLVLTGSLAIELVFQWQAMGELIFLAIDFQDIPLLLGILSIVGILTLVGHVVLDIIHVYLDPRLRYASRY